MELSSHRRTVLLIAPPSGYGHPWLFPPFSLLALARMFRGTGLSVRIVDGHVDPAWQRHALEALESVVIAGVTSTTGVQVRHGLDITRRIKSVRPDLPVCWGGFHASLYPRATVESPLIDYCIAGQGERAFLDLTRSVAGAADAVPRETIAGLVWKDRGAVRSNPQGFEALDEFPMYDYSFVRLDDYVHCWEGSRALSFITSTGCPFSCTFCGVPAVLERNFSGMTPERVLAEVRQLVEGHGVNYVRFFDDNYFTDRRRTLGVAEVFIDARLPVRYMAEPRVDLFSRLSDQEVNQLVKSGLDTILVGVESGSPEMLSRVKKRITVDQVLAAAQLARRHGLGGIFSFMGALPGETAESMLQSVALIHELLTISQRFTVSYRTYLPYYAGPAEVDRVKLQYPDYPVPRTLEDWAHLDPRLFQTEYFDSPLASEEINSIGWYAYTVSRTLSDLSLRPEWNPRYSRARALFHRTIMRSLGTTLLRLRGPRSITAAGHALRFVNQRLVSYTAHA